MTWSQGGAAGAAAPFAANAVHVAIWSQPVIAALVSVERGDQTAAMRALEACSSADRALVHAIVTKPGVGGVGGVGGPVDRRSPPSEAPPPTGGRPVHVSPFATGGCGGRV